jgi:hypothetical protein
MVVGFKTTCAISGYHHQCWEIPKGQSKSFDLFCFVLFWFVLHRIVLFSVLFLLACLFVGWIFVRGSIKLSF